MRKIDDSGNTLCSVSFSARADARSWPNGFSMMTRASCAQPDCAERLDHGAEQARRDGEVVRRAACAAELLRAARRTSPDRGSRRRRSAAASTSFANAASSTPPPCCSRLSRARARSCSQVPARLGDADHRHVEMAAPDHRLQRREDLLVGQVAGGAEEDQRVRARGGHRCSAARRPSRGGRRTESASPRAPCSRSRPRRAS